MKKTSNKFQALCTLALLLIVPTARASVSVSALFDSAAMQKICADVIAPVPGQPGYFSTTSPHFAVTPNAVYVSLQLPKNLNGGSSILKLDSASLNQATEMIQFNEEIKSLSFHEGKIWALFATKLISLDPTSKKVEFKLTTVNGPLPRQDYAAFGMVWMNDLLVISHGSYGIKIFDPKVGQITKTFSLNLDSGEFLSSCDNLAKIDDQHVIVSVHDVSMSNSAPFAFNGLKILDITTGEFSDHAYDRDSAGVIGYGYFLQVVGDSVLLNNTGILQVASLSGMASQGFTEIGWLPIQTSIHGRLANGQLVGDFLIEKNHYYGCANFTDMDPATHSTNQLGLVARGVLHP